MKSIVALVPCSRYDEEPVNEKVQKAIDLAGGLSGIIRKEEKILVKPNLLLGAASSKAVTTHPAVFGAVLNALKNSGYENLSYGDSSGSPLSNSREAAKVAGLEEAAEKYGVSFADFETGISVSYPAGVAAKKFTLAKAVCECDAVISVCKMKTHSLTTITGAVKNQYGCIPGAAKSLGHALYPTADIFSKMIVDLNNYIKPRLYIMDAVMAMEGNGPSSGNPVMMNMILASTDPVALDTVFALLVDLDPQVVPTIRWGSEQGLGKSRFDEISIMTEEGEISPQTAFEKYGKPDFDVRREKQSFWSLRALLFKSRKPKHRPVVDPDKCIACGVCEKACPVDGKAVHSGDGKKAIYDYSKCIRCYCCQEMCPAHAITRKER